MSLMQLISNNALAAEATELIINEGDTTIPQVIAKALDYVLPIFAAVALGFVVYAGVLYMISQGDPDKVGKAKRTLFWAIGGVMIVVLSYTIVTAVRDLAEDTAKGNSTHSSPSGKVIPD